MFLLSRAIRTLDNVQNKNSDVLSLENKLDEYSQIYLSDSNNAYAIEKVVEILNELDKVIQ